MATHPERVQKINMVRDVPPNRWLRAMLFLSRIQVTPPAEVDETSVEDMKANDEIRRIRAAGKNN